jgi:adhesin transport system outer membrane protein
VKAARYALDAARARVERARLDGSDAGRGYRQQVLGAKDRMSVLDQRTRSLSEARDLYREQYKLGTRSILDLLNTEQEYFQAISDEAVVRHDYWTGVVDYVAATGAGNEFYAVGTDAMPVTMDPKQ